MYEKKQDIVCRDIHGSIFLIDITEDYSNDTCSLYEINEIGEFIWDSISNNSAIDIARLLKSKIIEDIPLEYLLNDVTEYLNILQSNGFIIMR